jgi:hypothetical protein
MTAQLKRWWWALLLVAICLGAWRLRFDVEILDLLPPEEPAVQGLKIYQKHFTNARELIVTVRASDAEKAEQFAGVLAEKLRAQTNLVAGVTWQPPWLEQPGQLAEILACLWLNQPPEVFAALTNRLAPENIGSRARRNARGAGHVAFAHGHRPPRLRPVQPFGTARADQRQRAFDGSGTKNVRLGGRDFPAALRGGAAGAWRLPRMFKLASIHPGGGERCPKRRHEICGCHRSFHRQPGVRIGNCVADAARFDRFGDGHGIWSSPFFSGSRTGAGCRCCGC